MKLKINVYGLKCLVFRYNNTVLEKCNLATEQYLSLLVTDFATEYINGITYASHRSSNRNEGSLNNLVAILITRYVITKQYSDQISDRNVLGYSD